jgi:hypothetical protein
MIGVVGLVAAAFLPRTGTSATAAAGPGEGLTGQPRTA